MNYSKQNALILKIIKNSKEHPSIDKVYKEVLKENNKVSLATIYRNTDKLYRENLIQKIVLPNKEERYDGNTEKHYHAVCVKCGKIIDVFIDYLEDIDAKVEEKLKIPVLDHDIIFKTVCKDCIEK